MAGGESLSAHGTPGGAGVEVPAAAVERLGHGTSCGWVGVRDNSNT
jgi:hypothetical protein